MQPQPYCGLHFMLLLESVPLPDYLSKDYFNTALAFSTCDCLTNNKHYMDKGVGVKKLE